jgi:hypothetical protein
MTKVEINGSDTTTLRLLHLDLPPEAVERFTQMAGTGEWPLKYGLGATRLRDSFIDVVAIKDLEPMRLTQYLADAYDISPKVFGADLARVDTLTGHVVVLPPQAFDETSQTLSVAPPLTVIGSYGMIQPKARGAKLTAAAARGQGRGGRSSGLGQGGSRILQLLIAGIVVAAMIVAYLIVGN